MAIRARVPESKWTLAPQGTHQAVCCDVWEPWTVEKRKEWGGGLQDKTRLVWQLADEDPETNKRIEASQQYTLSLHEKATLCKHLESWRGRKFREEEKAAFDMEGLIGVNCQIQIMHNVAADGKTYANVTNVMPLAKGMVPLRVSEDFVRRKDRKKDDKPAGDIDDSDVPFTFLVPIIGMLSVLGGLLA